MTTGAHSIVGGIVLVWLGIAITNPVSAQCDQDFPTMASLETARTAIQGGSTDVTLSPGGCFRYQSSQGVVTIPLTGALIGFSRSGLTTFNGQQVAAWNYFQPLQQQLLQISEERDSDHDGFPEWRTLVVRQLPPAGPNPMSVEITESDPTSQTAVKRRKLDFPDDGTVHVTEEEGVGTLQVVSDYTDSDIVEAAPEPENSANLSPSVSAACPSNLAKDFDATVLAAVENGGKCLRSLPTAFMFGDAVELWLLSILRSFDINCETATNRNAAIQLSDVFDRRRAIRVWINLDYWNSPSTTANRRQSTVFHELMHAVLKSRHNPNLNNLRQNDRAHYREIDRVEACQSMCFDPTNATKCSCATCTGESSCQFCSTYKTCTTNQSGAYCNCKGNKSAYLHWYDSITQCTVDCPQGLSCFASNSCLQEVNVCR